MLQGQKIYGRRKARVDDGPISLGRFLYPTLPEDRFDRGPQERGSNKLVADVRLDNRDELAHDLGLNANRVATMSDSGLLFESLLRWGEKAVDRLVGEFAFAFWNSTERSLMLGRDLFGFRPLYFHRSDHFFAFASMPSGLHAIPDIPYEFDPDFVADSLALLPHAGTKTFYRAIERVEPATSILVRSSKISARRYWSPPKGSASTRTSADHEEGLRSVLDEAVRAQLRGAGPEVGCQLSSGLDSSIVAATAAREMKKGSVVAFTAVPHSSFDGPVPRGTIGDEGALATETTAGYPNMEHVLVESGSDTPLAALDRNHTYFQQPSVNLDNDVWSREINRAASSRKLSVLLIGSFGNMGVSYSGMEWLSALSAKGRWLASLQCAWQLARNGVPPRTLAAQILGERLPAPLWKVACRIFGRPTDFQSWSSVRPDRLTDIERRATNLGFDPLRRPSSDPLDYRLRVLFWVDVGNYVKGVLGEWGLSVRDPMSDRRVIEYCLSVPAEEYLKGGVTRSLARRAFADRLPLPTLNRIQRGYQSADWYEAVGRDLPRLHEEITAIDRCSPAREVMDMSWLKETVQTWPSDGWAEEAVMLRYRYGMLRAVQTGHFMRKVAGTN